MQHVHVIKILESHLQTCISVFLTVLSFLCHIYDREDTEQQLESTDKFYSFFNLHLTFFLPFVFYPVAYILCFDVLLPD
jgi:hypothetical protein